MNQVFSITFDIDWAPDWCVAMCANMCREAGVPATFFVTHSMDILDDLAADPLFELGIHPNFLPGSSHGNNTQAVLDACMTMVPSACSMRTHGLVQSSQLFSLIADKYPEIQNDASLLLTFSEGVNPTELYIGSPPRRIVRIPYVWEDDLVWNWPQWRWTPWVPKKSGAYVYNFHPIHVAINSADIGNYAILKEKMGDRAVFLAEEKDCQSLSNPGEGTATFLAGLLKSLSSTQTRTIDDIAESFRQGKK